MPPIDREEDKSGLVLTIVIVVACVAVLAVFGGLFFLSVGSSEPVRAAPSMPASTLGSPASAPPASLPPASAGADSLGLPEAPAGSGE